MAEDQGVNGDLWNDEAAVLLKLLGWTQIGDANIDVVTDENKKRGLDRIFFFNDPRRNSKIDQSVFVEAKRYNTANISKNLLQEWVTTLNNKLSKLKNSGEFQKMFPKLSTTTIRTGLIVIWFSNASDFPAFSSTFKEMLREVRALNRPGKSAPNSIYILTNDDILRLASLAQSIEKINLKHSTKLMFYYPPSENFINPIKRNEILTLDYMFSKIILCEGIINGVDHKVVFYFGKLTQISFERLKSFLQLNSILDNDKPLTIYTYQRTDEFRKIKPDVKKIFDSIVVEFKEMDIYQDLPTNLRLSENE